PLNAIIGFAEILRDQMFGPLGSERYVDYSRHIHASGTHLLDLINDVLDLSKIEAGRFELDEARIELAPLLHDCFDMVQARARAGGVAMALELPPILPPLWADDRALKQVVLNLLSNGVKFTPPGGQVGLSVACDREGIDIVVRDSGIGIAADALARVMHPFGQADASISRRFGGTGLGLPISKHLVELHGGALVVESELGAGTIVTVHLPANRVLSPVRRLEVT
ncbi:MAG TPA: ATP-binding protein, partial [Candidatus Sulfotelmatobacter sp.]|nr:ATP-binding protein [Candidatus Sulfotelmatobacter sp.]